MLALFRSIFAPPRDLILIIAAAWLGLALSEKRARRYMLSPEMLNNLVFVLMIAFLLGGRLLYAAEHLSAFAQNALNLVSFNTDLFDPAGGVAAAAVAGFAFGQRRGLPFWRTLDALTLFFASLSVGLGLSHLASGLAFGQETAVPWAIQLWGAARHPTQIYEIIAALGILGFLWSRKSSPRAGGDFLLFVALASASQLVIGGFRGDSLLLAGGLRLQQVVAWAVLAAALISIEYLLPARAPAPAAGADTAGAAPESGNTARRKVRNAGPAVSKAKAPPRRQTKKSRGPG